MLFAKTGIPEILRTGVQKAHVVGNEKVRDKSAVHLKGEVRGDRLNPLMGAMLKPEAMYPVDFWMEEQSADPVQIHVDRAGGQRLADRSVRDQPTGRHSDAEAAVRTSPALDSEWRARISIHV